MFDEQVLKQIEMEEEQQQFEQHIHELAMKDLQAETAHWNTKPREQERIEEYDVFPHADIA